jgi:hypothetical protein
MLQAARLWGVILYLAEVTEHWTGLRSAWPFQHNEPTKCQPLSTTKRTSNWNFRSFLIYPDFRVDVALWHPLWKLGMWWILWYPYYHYTMDIHLPNSDGPLNIDPYPKLYPHWGDACPQFCCLNSPSLFVNSKTCSPNSSFHYFNLQFCSWYLMQSFFWLESSVSFLRIPIFLMIKYGN